MVNKWVILTATGEFKYGGFYEPTLPVVGQDENGPIYDPAFSIMTLPGETMPDRRTERHDSGSPSKKRPATESEIASWDLGQGTRAIEPLEFMRRFTDAEKIGFEVLCMANTQNGATARVAKMTLALVKDRVHLDHADVLLYLGFMKAAHLLGDGTDASADIRIAQIRGLAA